MDDEVRRNREAHERASQNAQDFLSANPLCQAVTITTPDFLFRRDKSGNESKQGRGNDDAKSSFA